MSTSSKSSIDDLPYSAINTNGNRKKGSKEELTTNKRRKLATVSCDSCRRAKVRCIVVVDGKACKACQAATIDW